MARNRKKASENIFDATTIPLARPPQDDSTQDPLDDIPEEEKRRLIKESGLLGEFQKIQRSQEAEDDPPQQDMADEIFYTAILVVPLSFLFLIMDS